MNAPAYAPGEGASLLLAALDYATRGFPVLPLYNPTDTGCSCGKGSCGSPAKHPRTEHGLKDATTDPETIRAWWRRWPEANIGLATGTASGLVVIDVDGPEGMAALLSLAGKEGEIPSTPRSHTGRGYHLPFRHPGTPVRSRSAIGGHVGLDVRGDGGYIVAPPSRHVSGATYEWELGLDEAEIAAVPPWLLSILADTPSGNGHGPRVEIVEGRIPEGRRNAELTSIAGAMRRRGATEAGIEAGLLAENATRCDPPLPEREVCAIAASVKRYPPAALAHAEDDSDRPVEGWPDPPGRAAYYGVIGEIVDAVAPETEADPVGILVQLLTGFGIAVGRGPFSLVRDTRHYARDFVVMVGATASGRKGTGWDVARAPLAAIDPDWARDRIMGGLSSGEGLIFAVRDARVERKPKIERGGPVEYVEVEVDAGASDKRLLIMEPELARVLKVAAREGSILSTIIRDSWDREDLRILTKQEVKASGTHIGIVGHITAEELRRALTETDAASGFANRFLWICVRRARLLPEGGAVDSVTLYPLIERLREAAEKARGVGEMRRDPEARALWAEAYPRLTEGRAGLFGAIVGRADAHALRLSMLYALSDGSAVIQRAHVEAGLAVWDFAERSARFIFGASLGDPTADKILGALRDAAPGELTRAEINALFAGNKSREEIGRALETLVRGNLATFRQEKSGARGRPPELWRALAGRDS